MRLNVIAGVLVLASLFLFGCTQQPTGGGTPGSHYQPGNGRTVFTIADAAADLNSVSSVMITVDDVQVHSAAQGWVTVSSTPKTYDLLQLKARGTQALIADANITPGTYEQVRLDVSHVVVTDENGTREAKLPSGELKLVGQLVVNSNSTSSATFDFEVDKSLHATGNGEYVLAPVIRLQTKEDAEVEITSETEVRILGGHMREDEEFGMDENGTVGVGIRIPAGVRVVVDGGVVRVLPRANGRLVVGIMDRAANLTSVTSVNVTIQSIMVHSEASGWVTLSSTPHTYDLLRLQGRQALMADVNLSEGAYEQIRLNVSRVVITDANGTHEAKLPSGDLKVVGEFEVKPNSTASVSFDFLVNRSLHMTGNGTYVLAPVIHFETREGAEVEMLEHEEVEIRNGHLRANLTVGMDENGQVGEGREIQSDSVVEIENGHVSVRARVMAGIYG